MCAFFNMTRKRKHRYAMSILLIFCLLFAGRPFCSLMEDPSFGKADLSGAISSVRNLVQSADDLQVFSDNFQQAVTALNMAAGITIRITAEIPLYFSQSLGPHLLCSSIDSLFFPDISQLVLNPAPPVQSLISTPPLRPPLAVS
jgi:hypothetical protein